MGNEGKGKGMKGK